MVLATGFLGLSATTCGGSSSSTTAAHCTPGSTATCGGADGCAGVQVCNSDGASYAVCVCAFGDGGNLQSTDSGDGESGTTVAGGMDGPAAEAAIAHDSGVNGVDAAGDAGVDGGPWSPARLPGISLWLNTDVGVVQKTSAPGQVARWLDQSGSGNDATPGGTATTCNYDACVNPQVVNGHDVIACAGGMYVASSPSLDFGTGDFALAYVMMGSGTFWNEGGMTMTLGTDVAGDYSFGISMVGRAVIPEMSTSVFHGIIARGAAMDLVVDWGQATTGPTNTSTVITTVGSGLTPVCSGQEVAEIVAVKGTVSDAGRASLMGYFKAKFRL